MTEERRQQLRAILARNALAQDWVRFYIQRMQKNLKRLKIGKSQTLMRSFEREFTYRGGEISTILIRFMQYGRFVDMGVGRGLKAYERGTNNMLKRGARKGANVDTVRRRPKRWFNKTNTAQIWRLRELLEEDLGSAAMEQVRAGIVQMSEYTVKV